jgi:predicted amidohydrolase YtcJ
MNDRKLSALGGAAALTALISCSGGTNMADRIFINGTFHTLDPARPAAEALASREGEIIAVGSASEVRKLAGPRTETVDLGGGIVLPGFTDSHVHFVNGGFSLTSVQLRDAASRDEFVRRIGEKARSLPKGEWVLDGEWDHTLFTPVELPRRDWIDAVTPDNPVCVGRLDLHMVLVNSLALKLAGVTRNTPVPPGGEIVKDPVTGEPTGILKDAAMDLVYGVIPDPGPARTRRAIEAALRHAAEKGVTTVHDVSGEAGLDIYQDLLREGKLTTRIYFYFPISRIEEVLRMKLKTGFGNAFLRFGGLKGFADGSLGSSTALFFEPYADDPKAFGLFASEMIPEGTMDGRVRSADRAGLQCAIHAIGDRANAAILDIFAAAAAENGPRDRRFRIEHAQHLRPADITRFAKLGVIASVQPYHAADDGRWAERKIGPERAKTTYPFHSFLDAGATLIFGSDWPVAPMDPLRAIDAAVTRRTIDGANPGGWIPEQKISVAEAVRASTVGPAYAEFAEASKGTLEPGKVADLVVLDGDPFAIPAERLADLHVRMTIVGGRIVFKR